MNDTAQSRVLSAQQTTTLTTTANGQVIEGVNISVSGKGVSAINVVHNNVTIRQSFLSSSATDHTDYTRTIIVGSSSVAGGTITGLVVEDCEIVGAGYGIPNFITNTTWSGGSVTFTTTSPHGISVGGSFIIIDSTPVGYNGTYTATAGTTGSTLIAALAANPGAISINGTLVQERDLVNAGGYICAGYSTANNINEPFGGTFARNHMYGGIKAFGQCIANATIIDNLIHNMVGNDNDYIAPWGNSHDVDVEHNYLDQHDENVGGGDSVINMSNFGGPSPQNITNITFNNNAVIRDPAVDINPHSILIDSSFGSGVISNVKLTNNGFFNHATSEYSGGAGSSGVSANSGNYVMATATATSGALVFGTGVLTG